MKRQIIPISETRQTIALEFSVDQVNAIEASVVAEITKSSNLRGFRPGKAPKELIYKQYADAIKDEVRRKLVDESYKDLDKETTGRVLAVLKVDTSDTHVHPVTVTLTLDMLPEFTTPDFHHLQVSELPTTVEESEIDAEIFNLRKTRASYDKVERAVAKGDYVKVAYEGVCDGQPVHGLPGLPAVWGKQTATWEEAGAEKVEYGIPEIAAGIVGMSVNEKKEVAVTFPAGFAVAELSGKTAMYTVEVKEVREPKLPDHESIMKDVGATNIDAMRENMKKYILQRKQEQVARKQRDEVASALLTAVGDLPLPQSMIENETNEILVAMVQQAAQYGSSQADIETKRAEFIENAQKMARERTKLYVILEQIAILENIELNDQFLNRAVLEEAYARRIKPEQLVKELQKDPQGVHKFKQKLRYRKTMEHIVELAVKNAQDKNLES